MSTAHAATPSITGTPARTATVGTRYEFNPAISDPDGDAVNTSIWAKPDWATFSNGRLYGTPTAAGVWSGIEIWVDDGGAWALLGPFTIEVKAAAQQQQNRAPTISGTAPVGNVGVAFSFKPAVVDPDGNPVTINIWAKPDWAVFSNGVLTGTPTAAGTWSGIEIWADDGKAWTLLGPFSIEVKAAPTTANRAPSVTGTVPTATVGKTFTFKPAISDADGDKLETYIWAKPDWATYANGVLTGTPAKAGTWPGIEIWAGDGKTWTRLGPFSLTVQSAAANANRAPLITGAPAAATVGTAFSFTPATSDPDGDKVTTSITAKPTWATFSNGTLSGTPTTAGTWSGIEIVASDGKASTRLGPFSITAAAAAGTVKISGTPATTVKVGATYSFKPAAAESSGAAIYFSVSNKPAWATFNTMNGTLSGTPLAAHAGNFAGIAITATNGKTSAALAPFAISVTAAPVATGSATLAWSKPTQNVDGSTLTTLAGYRIYYGTSASQLTQVIDITDASATSYVVGALPPSTFFFALKSYVQDGSESVLSSIVSKTIL